MTSVFTSSTNPGGEAVGLESEEVSYMLCRKFHMKVIHRCSRFLIRKDTVGSVYLKDNHGER